MPIRFTSRVPSAFGLPEISNNFAEGLVFKPQASLPITQRHVIKRKIEEFSEGQFDESKSWNPHQLLSRTELLTLMLQMINPARVASARSKVGDNSALLIEEAILDVFIDLEAAFPKAMRSLTAEDEEALRFEAVAAVRALLH